MNEEIDNTEIEDVDLNEVDDIEETEEKPAKGGYIGREDWIAAGRDPDSWTSKKAYDDIGRLAEANARLHQKIEHVEQTSQYAIQNMTTYYQAQLNEQALTLQQQRNEAIEMADPDEVRRIEAKQWEVYNQAQAMQQPQHLANEQRNQQIADWYNGLMTDNPSRQGDIEDKIAGAMSRNPGNIEAIANEVNNYVKSFKPTVNPKRLQAGVTGGGKRGGGSMTMADLTPEERATLPYFKTKEHPNGDEKALLNALANIKKGS